MRVLLIFGLFAACNAGDLGYRYSQPSILSGPGSIIGGGGAASYGGSSYSSSFGVGGGSGSFDGGLGGLGGLGGVGGLGGSLGYGGGVGAEGGHLSVSGGHVGAPIISKHFYVHSAPDETEAPLHKQIIVGTPRKNYRVVFIKAPSVNRAHGKITLVPAPNEDKTVIYVLSKKTDAADIQADIQPSHDQLTKPEVFFIKYKTQEEAIHAQRQIQAQYDALGGASQFSDEGIAPVQSVIGTFGSGGGNGGHFTGSGSIAEEHFDGGATTAVHAGGHGYLPPK